MTSAGALPVVLEQSAVAFADPFSTFVALREALGENEVALFESLGGPDIDNRAATVHYGRLAEVTVRRREVRIDGMPGVVAHLASRLRDAGLVEGADRTDLAGSSTVWDVARTLQSAFEVEGARADAFDFGFCVVLGYELAGEIEDLRFDNPAADDLPDLVLAVYASTLSFDLARSAATLIRSRSSLWEPTDGVPVVAAVEAGDPRPPASEARYTLDHDVYLGMAEAALEHIRAGDIYQVQLGHEVRVDAVRDDLAVYQRMRLANPSPYMAFIPMESYAVLSGSPELHVRVSGDRLLMRPIAGTVRRGADEAENARNREWLASDEKEIAEHIMLVDLCRNDLGRVAVTGSVEVDQLMTIEEYSHVFHLVSTVSARLREGEDVYDVIRATFPAGTMTGTPKIRAMEIIEELENSRRGVYAGVFGLIGSGGFANLALSIRTIVAGPAGYSLRASAGVVIDSRPESEWRETLAKMGASARATTGKDLT